MSRLEQCVLAAVGAWVGTLLGAVTLYFILEAMLHGH
jgi:hypothetical protein